VRQPNKSEPKPSHFVCNRFTCDRMNPSMYDLVYDLVLDSKPGTWACGSKDDLKQYAKLIRDD